MKKREAWSDWIGVHSSNVGSIRYDYNNHVLQVYFKTSGHTYEYWNVLQHLFYSFAKASSKGRFVWQFLYYWPYQRRI